MFLLSLCNKIQITDTAQLPDSSLPSQSHVQMCVLLWPTNQFLNMALALSPLSLTSLLFTLQAHLSCHFLFKPFPLTLLGVTTFHLCSHTTLFISLVHPLSGGNRVDVHLMSEDEQGQGLCSLHLYFLSSLYSAWHIGGIKYFM